MDVWEQLVWKIKPIQDLYFLSVTVLGTNVKESIGVGAGGVSPPALQRFFELQVLNGAILALFYHFLIF